MTKADIISDVSKTTGFTKVEVEILLDSIINSIKLSLANGERVDMRGFGSFLVKKREARNTRNPATNEIWVAFSWGIQLAILAILAYTILTLVLGPRFALGN